MRQDKKKRRVVGIIAWVMALVMVGSSFAAYSQTLLAVNEFSTAIYDTKLIDDFKSPSGWLPGVEVNKDVSVKNDGTIPVFAKITISQSWVRTKNIYDDAGNIVPPAKDSSFPLTFGSGATEEYAALINWGPDVVLLASGQATKPSLSYGLPTVSTPAQADGKWLLMSEVPNSNGEYTLYYMGTIPAGGETPFVVDGATFNPRVENDVLSDSTVWDKNTQTWVTGYTRNPYSSYENARYTMSVAMHTVQATPDAVDETYPTNGSSEQSVVSYLKTFGKPGEQYSAHYRIAPHELSFSDQNGSMVFSSRRYSPEENWFLSELDMVPGGHCEDKLSITNRSDESYDLFMRAIVRTNQAANLNELLKYVTMKVYLGNELLYDGTALGDTRISSASVDTLYNAIPLGAFAPGQNNEIRVEMALDKNIPITYAGLLSYIDWEFMVEKLEEPPPPPPDDPPTPKPTPTTPKTGDILEDGTWYLIVMAVSTLCLLACIVYLVWGRRRRGEDTYFSEVE